VTAQEPFHDFVSRAGGLALFPIVLVPLVDDGDFLAEIARIVSLGSRRGVVGLTHGIRLRLRGSQWQGRRWCAVALHFLAQQPAKPVMNAPDS
jgi:hypothetical protein